MFLKWFIIRRIFLIIKIIKIWRSIVDFSIVTPFSALWKHTFQEKKMLCNSIAIPLSFTFHIFLNVVFIMRIERLYFEARNLYNLLLIYCNAMLQSQRTIAPDLKQILISHLCLDADIYLYSVLMKNVWTLLWAEMKRNKIQYFYFPNKLDFWSQTFIFQITAVTAYHLRRGKKDFGVRILQIITWSLKNSLGLIFCSRFVVFSITAECLFRTWQWKRILFKAPLT